MEHFLAMMVSVPPSSGWMHINSARGIRKMEHLLVMMVSLPALPLPVGQTTVIFFLYRLLTLTRGPNTIFLTCNLLPSNIIPHKQHQEIRKKYEQFMVGNLVFE
jgi:hypothetical protein